MGYVSLVVEWSLGDLETLEAAQQSSLYLALVSKTVVSVLLARKLKTAKPFLTFFLCIRSDALVSSKPASFWSLQSPWFFLQRPSGSPFLSLPSALPTLACQ